MVVPLDTGTHGWLQEDEGLTVMFKQEMAEGHNKKTKSKTTSIIAAIVRVAVVTGRGGADCCDQGWSLEVGLATSMYTSNPQV